MTDAGQPIEHDVVVVGGGFAGVTAARDCAKNGYSTLLLEARERLGGRTHTVTLAGHKVELGGTWIHWSQPFVWAEKERYGLALAETPEGVDRSRDQITVLTAKGPQRLEGAAAHPVVMALQSYFEDARQLWERPFDAGFTRERLLAADAISARDRLQQLQLGEVERTAVECFMAGLANGSSSEISYAEVARWWSASGWSFQALDDAAGRYRLAEGTARLIECMVADGRPELRLGCAVQRIEDDGQRVVLTTRQGERVAARSVVIALPMNCLPDVEWSPPLHPRVLEAGRAGHAGRGLKVIARVTGGAEHKQLGLGGPQCPLNIAFTYARDSSESLFVGFGSDARALDGNDRGAVERALRLFFPELQVQECLSHDWVADPFSRGTWANYRTGWLANYQPHFQQDRGRIVFGQGDHGEGWRGFIDGAIGAGAKAAHRVRALLG